MVVTRVDFYDTIEDWWELMPKANGENVTFFDLVDFFKLYDPGYDNVTDEGLFEVTEDQFAAAWGRQLNVSYDAAHAYFKRMDISQYFILLPELITETDCLLIIDQFDLDGSGDLDEFEFIGQLSRWFSDLPWGVMFHRYKTPGTDTIICYDDAVTYHFEGVGGWHDIFNDINTDGDDYLTVNEMRAFFAAGDYGSAKFAEAFFFEADITGSGTVDKRFEWAYFFNRADVDGTGSYLSYPRFTEIDYIVRPIGLFDLEDPVEASRVPKLTRHIPSVIAPYPKKQ